MSWHCLLRGGLFCGCPTKLHHSQPRGTETQYVGLRGGRCGHTHQFYMVRYKTGFIGWKSISRGMGGPKLSLSRSRAATSTASLAGERGPAAVYPPTVLHRLQRGCKEARCQGRGPVSKRPPRSSFSLDLPGQPAAVLPEGRRGWASAAIRPGSPPPSDRCGPPSQCWPGSVCRGPASWGRRAGSRCQK